MDHDDLKPLDDIEKSDIILLGVSRTSKTPTAIYLATEGLNYKYLLVNEKSIPNFLKNPDKRCVIGLTLEPRRLVTKKNRMNSLKKTTA